MQIKIERDNLIRLLKKTQRPQTVAGKKIEQVHGCMLSLTNDYANTTSLVKDGVTSVASFNEPIDELITTTNLIDGVGHIPIPNIKDMLGILSMHNTSLLLAYENNKLRIKSGGKQTTLAVSENALAFPHSPDLLKEWSDKSKNIAGKFSLESDEGWAKGQFIPKYRKNDGEILTPLYCAKLSANVLYEALRCDGINGQKLNNYTFNFKEGDGLYVQVGNELKGQTESLVFPFTGYSDLTSTVNGGLENVLKHMDGEIVLSLFDFTEADMGCPIVITTPTGELIYQAANLGEMSYVR